MNRRIASSSIPHECPLTGAAGGHPAPREWIFGRGRSSPFSVPIRRMALAGAHGRILPLGGEGDVTTAIDQPDGKAGLERLWLLIVLAVAYTVSMVIIVAVARPNDR